MSQETLEAPPPVAVRQARTPIMGYVRGVFSTSTTTSQLVVLMADRSTWTTQVPFAADVEELAAELPPSHHPLSVRIELDGGEVRSCSCLVATPGGPYRLALSGPAALALTERGRHTLLIRRGPVDLDGR